MATSTRTRTKPSGTFPLPPGEDDIAAAKGNGLVPLKPNEIDAALLSVGGVAGDITEKMLGAEDLDELLGGTEPTAALVGVTFALRAWKWLRSQKKGKGSAGVFVVMEITDLNGKERVVSSGSQNILTALRWFELKGHAKNTAEGWAANSIPPLTVRESETADGNTVYRFTKPIGA